MDMFLFGGALRMHCTVHTESESTWKQVGGSPLPLSLSTQSLSCIYSFQFNLGEKKALDDA